MIIMLVNWGCFFIIKIDIILVNGGYLGLEILFRFEI